MRLVMFMAVWGAVCLAQNAYADECEGIVLQDIQTIEGTPLHKGKKLSWLHEGDADASGKPLTYEEHGGSVYPADKVRLTNCHVVTHKGSYSLVLNDPVAHRREERKGILMEKYETSGMSYAEAGNTAEAWLDRHKEEYRSSGETK